MNRRFRMNRFYTALMTASLLCLNPGIVRAQAPKGRVGPDSPKPPLTYHGLIPGFSTAKDVLEKLGEPLYEAPWYAYKRLYPARGRPGMFDSVHTEGKDGVYACAEAATIPDGYETRDAVLSALGSPEFELRMATFHLLDYTGKGLRFIVTPEGNTLGVAYVPRVRTRVHSGARKRIDLSRLREGPQPRPKKTAVIEGLKVGVAEVKITPVTSAWINPVYRKEYRVHDDLRARCAVFEKGDLTVALVGADLFGMSYRDIVPMIEKLRNQGIEHFILAMSHTHSAPDTIGIYGHYPDEYIRFLQNRIPHAVLEAHASLQPVRGLRTASRELPMDGARVMGLIRNARNPGILDPTVSVLQILGENEKPISTLVNLACHPEGLEKGVVELSADYPGYLCEQVRRDGGGQPVFLNGALGGMVSGDSRARTHDETRKMGLRFAGIVRDLLMTAQPPETFEFAVQTRRVEIPVTNPELRPFFEKMRPLHEGRVVTEMTLFTLGECQMITIPGELLPEISFEIQEKMKGFPRMLIGLANDELGYIIPPYDFREGEYEESMSQGPAAGPVIRDTAVRMLEGIE